MDDRMIGWIDGWMDGWTVWSACSDEFSALYTRVAIKSFLLHLAASW